MNEQMMQMMMQLMLNNQQMTQAMFQLMMQPQPNPVLGATTPEQMAQTGAASVSIPTPQEVSQAPQVISATETNSGLREENTRLRSQVEQMQAQIEDLKAKMQAQITELEAANARASTAEAQAAQTQAQYDQLEKDVEVVAVSQGRTFQEIVEESYLMTGDDYYDRNREEYQNMSGQEAHQLIQDKMDIKDDWIKQNSTEEEYKAYRSKLHEREKEQYLEQHGMVDFSKNMVDVTDTPGF